TANDDHGRSPMRTREVRRVRFGAHVSERASVAASTAGLRTDARSETCAPNYSRITHHASCPERASTFIIVLWIAFGLVSVALYFGHAMQYELRASDNRVSGQAAEQAIEGAVRYINNLLAYQSAYGSNGIMPDVTTYVSEAVPV